LSESMSESSMESSFGCLTASARRFASETLSAFVSA
jgi:hypothetical protein